MISADAGGLLAAMIMHVCSHLYYHTVYSDQQHGYLACKYNTSSLDAVDASTVLGSKSPSTEEES